VTNSHWTTRSVCISFKSIPWTLLDLKPFLELHSTGESVTTYLISRVLDTDDRLDPCNTAHGLNLAGTFRNFTLARRGVEPVAFSFPIRASMDAPHVLVPHAGPREETSQDNVTHLSRSLKREWTANIISPVYLCLYP